MDDDVSDRIRLQISVSICTRYGALLSGMSDALRIPVHRVSISADVRIQGILKSVASLAYPTLSIDSDGLTSTSDGPCTTARYLSDGFLSQNFVLLLLRAEGLDAPWCHA